MLPRSTALFGAALSALACACSPTPVASPSLVLPLRTLRLYETGVGYFERSGAIGSPTTLPVPAGHLDDALQTLVILGGKPGAGTVRGVEFGSSISRGMARTLAGLPASGDEPLGLEQILVGLKGAGVEVKARQGSHTGRVVEVVRATVDGAVARESPGAAEAQGEVARPSEPQAALTLLLLTDAGALVRVPLAEVESVRPLDPGYAARLGSALDALSSRGARSERMLRVLGGGPVTLGYVAEAPVWRTTYRLVLDEDGAGGALQGWALLHNDTDEDWSDVRVELANGRPDSFLFPLAAPRYARRQLVTPDDQLATIPQLMGTTVDSLYGDPVGDTFGAGGLGLSGQGEGGGGRGEGIGLGSVGTIGHGAGVGAGSDLLRVGNLAGTSTADGVEAGALFVYPLPERVGLRAHGSALVPFADRRVEARAITWLDSPSSPARSAVRFVNTTSQTLPAGTLAFFGDGGFAGESALPRLKPGDRRFLTYGMDLDVEIKTRSLRAVDEPKRLVWDDRGRQLEEHYLRTTDATYVLENRGGRKRSVVLATSLDANATLTGAEEVDFDAGSGRPLAVFSAPARSRAERAVHAVEGLVRATGLAALTAERMSELAAAPSLQPSDRAPASEAAARLKEARDDDAAVAQAKADIAEVDRDLGRLREHMKALGVDHAGPGIAGNPFAARVLAAEDRLSALRRRGEAAEAHGKARREAAAAALSRLGR